MKIMIQDAPSGAALVSGATCPKCQGTDTRILEELSDTDRWVCSTLLSPERGVCGNKFRLPTSERPLPPAEAGAVSFDSEMTTTALELPEYKIVRNLGVVQGLTVRSRSVLGNIGASLQMTMGGDITLFTKMCEQSRQEAYKRMLKQAIEAGANAVISMRYDATEIAPGVTEVLAYGTAVVVEPETK